MIDIEVNNERDLKNIRQIGTPTQEDKIYIENAVYARIHEEDYTEKKVFVFMGHTECIQGRYTTFIEAAIPVLKMEYVQNVPQWNNQAWSDVFREVKRSYQNSIIVGWGMDQKGYAPSMTPELEAIHREQFGGAHQVLFLMDSIEGEESFYINKGNWLQKKEGFYIFYSRELRQVCPPEVVVEMPKRTRSGAVPTESKQDRAQYRKKIQQKENGAETHKASSYAMTAAVALLVVIVGLGIMQDRIHVPGFQKVVQTVANLGAGNEKKAKVLVGTEVTGTEEETQTPGASYTETLDLIPIESLEAGDIKKIENTQQNEPDTEEQNMVTEEKEQDQSKEKSEAKTVSTGSVPEYYVVKAGDTLTAICKKVYGTTEKLKEIEELNQLEDANDIHVEQKLLLP